MALEYADRGYVFQIGEIFLEDRAGNLLENEEVKRSFLRRSEFIGFKLVLRPAVVPLHRRYFQEQV